MEQKSDQRDNAVVIISTLPGEVSETEEEAPTNDKRSSPGVANNRNQPEQEVAEQNENPASSDMDVVTKSTPESDNAVISNALVMENELVTSSDKQDGEKEKLDDKQAGGEVAVVDPNSQSAGFTCHNSKTATADASIDMVRLASKRRKLQAGQKSTFSISAGDVLDLGWHKMKVVLPASEKHKRKERTILNNCK